jgi:hypothetical protein
MRSIYYSYRFFSRANPNIPLLIPDHHHYFHSLISGFHLMNLDISPFFPIMATSGTAFPEKMFREATGYWAF